MSGGSFGLENLLSHTSSRYDSRNIAGHPAIASFQPVPVSIRKDSGGGGQGHLQHHHHQPISHSTPTGFVTVVTQAAGPSLTSSPPGGSNQNGVVTTLELHPNVILGMGEEEEELDQGESGGSEPGRPHLCSICHASYKTRTHLRRHMCIHMSNRPFPCQDCGKGFNRREHLNKHIEAMHSPSKHNCPYCHKEISRMDHLKRHIKNMHTNKPKPANPNKGAILKVEMACGLKQKAQISFLSPHFPSGTIGQTIITPIPLGSSIIHHGGGQGQLKPKSETSSSSSTSQMTSCSSSGVEDDSPPSMTIIPSNILGPGQGVATLSIQNTPTQKVLVHQRLPSGCGTDLNVTTATNGLASLANLNLSLGGHSLTDSGGSSKKMPIPLYNCGQCGSTFTTEKDLTLHARCHKAQPHRCPECPRAYTRREKLTEHIRCVHEGHKFGCELCGKKLSRKDHVLRHIRSVHPEVYAATFAEMDDGYITLDEHGKLISTRNPSSSGSPPKKRRKLADGETVGMPAIGDVGVLLRSVCHMCLKVFGTAYHLTRHIESCHSGDVRPFNCTACNKMFKRKDHLTKHVKSHCPTLKEAVHAAQAASSQNHSEKNSTPDSVSLPNKTKIEDVSEHHPTKTEEREGGLGTASEGSASSTDCHHAILQNFQVQMDTSRHGGQHGIHHGGNTIDNTALLMDASQHKHSEYSLAVIDSFMQGNVNVVVVDEDISNFLQQASNSHLTTTFPCGQCQKEFHARDQLIAHLQEHANDSVLPSGQHIADISFTDF